MEGKWINSSPRNASLAFSMGKNIYIVACVDPPNFKMVKIRVTGQITFDWMEAKYQKLAQLTANCKAQGTFTAECFVGTSVKEQQQYNVVLIAKQVESKFLKD